MAYHQRKRVPQSKGTFRHGTGGFAGRTIRHFPSDDWGDTEEVAHNELLRRTIRILVCRHPVEGAFIDGQRIGLVLCGRHFVKHPGQHLPFFACGEVDAFENTDDLIVYVGDDDVRKLAHDLGDDVLLCREAEFVVGIERDPCRAFKAELFDGGYTRSCEMLPQHHAEHRWYRRLRQTIGVCAPLRHSGSRGRSLLSRAGRSYRPCRRSAAPRTPAPRTGAYLRQMPYGTSSSAPSPLDGSIR